MDRVVLITNRWSAFPEMVEEKLEARIINDSRCFGSTGPKGIQTKRLKDNYQREDALRILPVFQNLTPAALQIRNETTEQKMFHSETRTGREIIVTRNSTSTHLIRTSGTGPWGTQFQRQASL